MIARWLVEPVDAGVERSLARLARLEDVVRIVVLPDVHEAGPVCVGTVLATRRRLYPAAAGGDLGCGVTTVRLDLPADRLADERAAARLLDGLYRHVPVSRHHSIELPEDLVRTPLSSPALERLRRTDGRVQFATLGRGNHFVELQADAEGALWVAVHAGSRAMGPAIRDHHVPGRPLDPIDADGDAGRAYLDDAAWARRYAAAGRRRMAETVAALLDCALDDDTWIEADHNHVQAERHDGQDLWIHRKGALAAGRGQPGIMPGSMGTVTFHVEGTGSPASLGSASHGAGRALTRTEAGRRIGVDRLLAEMEGVWFDQRHAARLVEEAPGAYKDIRAVLRAQRDLVRIVRELRPVLVYKGA